MKLTHCDENRQKPLNLLTGSITDIPQASLILEIFSKHLTELWAFFDLSFAVGLGNSFLFNNFIKVCIAFNQSFQNGTSL